MANGCLLPAAAVGIVDVFLMEANTILHGSVISLPSQLMLQSP